MTSTSNDQRTQRFRQAVYWRGMLVQRYAAVEYGITLLIAASAADPDYSSFGTVPFPLASKIARLRKLVRAPGIIAMHQSDIEDYLEAFEEFNDMRQFMVHGDDIEKIANMFQPLSTDFNTLLVSLGRQVTAEAQQAK